MKPSTSSRLTLVSHHLCPYVQRAAILLDEKRIDYERIQVDLANKPEWFTRISPLGRVPLLIVGDSVVFESAVICEYLDEVTDGSLLPADPLEKARHRSFIEFGSAILNDIGGFYSAANEERLAEMRQKLADKFARLESELGEGPYFTGTQFSLVDAVFGPIFRYFDSFDKIADFGIFEGLPKVIAYRQALAKRPSIKDAVAVDYPARLEEFFARRGSHLSRLMENSETLGAMAS